MPETKHPLTNNNKWVFSQPSVGFSAHYVAVDSAGKREVRHVQTATTCREGVISNLRQAFQNSLINVEEYKAAQNLGWTATRTKVALKTIRSVDLDDVAGKEKPTTLKLLWHENYRKGWEEFPIEKFLQVCDVVMGPVMVLMSPARPMGADWWRSDPEKAIQDESGQKFVHWYGSDNWFLAHPATLSIATGLYRQCFHLCAVPGLADQIIATLSPDEVTAALSTNRQVPSLGFLKRTRQYIEVPVGANGTRQNYAFALGFWRRLIRLQRAIRRVGYADALGQDFPTGWALTSAEGAWRGVYNFWGDEGELTEHHRHLMKVGAPRRKTSGEKVANRIP
jgi:hypothetical protein